MSFHFLACSVLREVFLNKFVAARGYHTNLVQCLGVYMLPQGGDDFDVVLILEYCPLSLEMCVHFPLFVSFPLFFVDL